MMWPLLRFADLRQYDADYLVAYWQRQSQGGFP